MPQIALLVSHFFKTGGRSARLLKRGSMSSGTPVNDVISVKGLRLSARIGASEEERAKLQPLRIDLRFGLRDKVAASELLESTFDYSVVDAVLASVFRRPMRLLETAATVIVEAFCELPQCVALSWIEVEVAKLAPPIATIAESASVWVRREVGR